jgi:uncharacterized protein YbjT (DUF2867 family)
MKILLTGATGYIGKRLLPSLIQKGHYVVCCVRDKKRFTLPNYAQGKAEVIETDFLKPETLKNIPKDIDGAYYLMHSMSTSSKFEELELSSAGNFREAVNNTNARHVVFLTGIINEEKLSAHLESRKAVEEELAKGKYHFTALRAGIIIGSGSASYEIIRDLVEKLPVMVAPKWLNTLCQPIAVRDVIKFLERTLFEEKTFDKDFDIGGPDVISYKEMLYGYAKARGLKRKIFIVPVMTPKLSSYWLYLITSTTFKLAAALVDSMKINVICRNNDLNKILGIETMGYQEALKRTLDAIESNNIISGWKDSMISGSLSGEISEYITVPTFGCLTDERIREIKDREKTIEKIWRLGGDTGWYYANWLWKWRGYLDKFFGGVGLRRGRTHPNRINTGDVIDFWRVLYADRNEGRLLLFAEMKLPGEAWLEFKIENGKLKQTATFRPKGVLGRLYWHSTSPFHYFIFNGLIDSLTEVEA